MNIEQELHRALARKPAPPQLADRVLERIDRERQPVRGGTARHIRWLAAAAALVLAVGGGVRYYEQQRQAAEAERVKQEIQTALQITGDVFARAQMRLAQSVERR